MMRSRGATRRRSCGGVFWGFSARVYLYPGMIVIGNCLLILGGGVWVVFDEKAW